LIIRNRPSLKSQVDIGSDPDNHLLFLSGQKADVDLIHSIANSLCWQKEPVCHYIYCDAKITFFEQMGSAPPTEAGGGASQILVGPQFGSSSSQGRISNRIEDSPEHWQPNISSHLAIESADADFAQVDFLFRVNHFAVDASGAEDCDGTVELHRKMKVAYGKPFEMRIADLDNPDKIHCVQWTIQPPMSMEERNKLASQKAKLAHDLKLLFAAALQAKELCLCWIE
jgi:hypothetical protein